MLNFWLRNLILWGCRLVGTIYGLLRRAVVLNLMILLLIGGGLWLADYCVARWSFEPVETAKPEALASPSAANETPPANSDGVVPKEGDQTSEETQQQGKEAGGQVEKKPWLTLWNVLSLWAFGMVAWWVAQSRRRLVISKFEDHTDGKSGIDAGGFGVLVAAELARLSDLFSEFEAGRSIQSIPEKLEPIDATFQTESAGEFLQNTVSAETKFSLGPLEVPVGVILNLVGQLVQGPRLTGQLHSDGGQRIITLRLAGSRRNRSWIVRDQALTFQEDKVTWRPATEVAHELACRLFAELAMDRSVTWEALSQFVTGVRAYRWSIQTPKRRKLNLREAEHGLMQAIAEDPDFDLAYYNLGVVSLGLGKLEAARAAFARAMEKNNRRWATYYALALINNLLAQQAFKRTESEAAKLHHSRALDLCDQALDLSPSSAEAASILSLKAIVLWWRGFRMWAVEPMTQKIEFERSGVMARRAIRKAWQALCCTELGFGMSPRERPFALAHARSMASRQLQNWSGILLAAAGPQALPGRAAIKAARDAAETRKRVAQTLRKAAEVVATLRKLEQQTGLRAMAARALARCALWGWEISMWFSEAFLRINEMNFPTDTSQIHRRILLREATYVLRQASSLTPEETSVYIDLGRAYIDRRRYGDAIESLSTATRLAPGSLEPWGFLALAYARLGRRGHADEASKRLLANVSGASQESLEALEKAMDTLKEPFLQIEEYTAAIPKDERIMQAPFFRRWSRRQRRRLRRWLAGHDRRHYKEGAEEFDRLLNVPDYLRVIIDNYENTQKRLADLRQFGDKIKDLSMKGDEGIAHLKELFEEKTSLEHDWEVGEIGERLVRLYLERGQLPEAEDYLRRTIAHLKKTVPREIQRRGLHALLARVLRERLEYPAALEQAKLGVAWDPVNPYERIELGWAYLSLAEFASAQSAWEDALLLAPQDPNLHVKLGGVHLSQVEDSQNKAERNDRIASATRHLQTALALYEGTDPARGSARFLLSRAYDAAGRYADAVRELRALERSDYCKLAVAIQLAEEYLKRNEWTESERRFWQIASDVDVRMQTAKDGPNELVETPPGADDMLLGTASAYAHLGIACSLAEREIFLDRALAEVARARDALKDLKREELEEYWAGRCTYFEGVILAKLGQIDQAIPRLETALASSADTGTYFALADALARKAELAGDIAQKAELVRRATRYYQETQRLDWNGELEDRVARALARLQPVITE